MTHSVFTQSFSSTFMLYLDRSLVSPAVAQTTAAPERAGLTDLEEGAQSSRLLFALCSMCF